MSDPAKIQTMSPPGGAPIRSAIAQAARATDVDFRFLLGQAKVESGLDASARARSSSATGLFQFVENTWLDVMRRHGPALGLGDQAAAVDDPRRRGQILALRNDPQIASLMAGALAQDNRAALAPTLGRDPDAGELYLAHFLGAQGAGRFLTALSQTPERPAAELFARPAAANRAIFYDKVGAPRSLAAVMAVLRGRIETAMAGEAAPVGPAETLLAAHPALLAATRPINASDATRLRPAGQPGALTDSSHGASRPPITAVLKASFALNGADGGAGGGDHAQRAYTRLKAFGL